MNTGGAMVGAVVGLVVTTLTHLKGKHELDRVNELLETSVDDEEVALSLKTVRESTLELREQIHELQTAHALALEQIAVLKEELETIERTTEKQLTASLKAQEVLQSMEQTAVDNTHTTVLLENERNSLQGIVDTLQEQNELTIGERNLSEAVLQATLADSLKMQERIEKFKMENQHMRRI